MNDVKRLPLETLELWKRKATALDEALQYLDGLDVCGRCLRVRQILEAGSKPKGEN